MTNSDNIDPRCIYCQSKTCAGTCPQEREEQDADFDKRYENATGEPPDWRKLQEE